MENELYAPNVHKILTKEPSEPDLPHVNAQRMISLGNSRCRFTSRLERNKTSGENGSNDVSHHAQTNGNENFRSQEPNENENENDRHQEEEQGQQSQQGEKEKPQQGMSPKDSGYEADNELSFSELNREASKGHSPVIRKDPHNGKGTVGNNLPPNSERQNAPLPQPTPERGLDKSRIVGISGGGGRGEGSKSAPSSISRRANKFRKKHGIFTNGNIQKQVHDTHPGEAPSSHIIYQNGPPKSNKSRYKLSTEYPVLRQEFKFDPSEETEVERDINGDIMDPTEESDDSFDYAPFSLNVRLNRTKFMQLRFDASVVTDGNYKRVEWPMNFHCIMRLRNIMKHIYDLYLKRNMLNPFITEKLKEWVPLMKSCQIEIDNKLIENDFTGLVEKASEMISHLEQFIGRLNKIEEREEVNVHGLPVLVRSTIFMIVKILGLEFTGFSLHKRFNKWKNKRRRDNIKEYTRKYKHALNREMSKEKRETLFPNLDDGLNKRYLLAMVTNLQIRDNIEYHFTKLIELWHNYLLDPTLRYNYTRPISPFDDATGRPTPDRYRWRNDEQAEIETLANFPTLSEEKIADEHRRLVRSQYQQSKAESFGAPTIKPPTRVRPIQVAANSAGQIGGFDEYDFLSEIAQLFLKQPHHIGYLQEYQPRPYHGAHHNPVFNTGRQIVNADWINLGLDSLSSPFKAPEAYSVAARAFFGINAPGPLATPSSRAASLPKRKKSKAPKFNSDPTLPGRGNNDSGDSDDDKPNKGNKIKEYVTNALTVKGTTSKSTSKPRSSELQKQLDDFDEYELEIPASDLTFNEKLSDVKKKVKIGIHELETRKKEEEKKKKTIPKKTLDISKRRMN